MGKQMKLYQVRDTNDKIVGETSNVQELNRFLIAHPGYRSQTLGEVTEPTSTLPVLQEEPAKPKGDFLQQ